MKIVLFCLTLIIMSIKAYGIDRSDINGAYLNEPLPTWIENEPISPTEALKQVYLTEHYPTSGFSDNAYWNKLTFPASGHSNATTYYLKASNFMIDELNFYLFHGTSLVKQWARGDRQTWNDNETYEGIWIPITLDASKKTSLLIRRSSSGPILLPIALYDQSVIYQAKKQQNTLWVMSLTALVLLLGYNILIYLLTRERSFFYYVLFNAGLILSLGFVLGFSRYLVPNDRVHEWLSVNILTLHSILLWTVCRFSLSFLNIEKHHPFFWTHRFKMDAIFAALIVISGLLEENKMAPIFLAMQIAGSALCTYWAFYTKSVHTLATRLYLFSWSIFILGALTGSLIYWELMPYNSWTEYAFLLSSLCQLLGFSFAYSARIRQLNEDRHFTNLTDSLTGLPNRQFLLTEMQTLRPVLDNEDDADCLVLIVLAGHHSLIQAVGPAKADIAVKKMFININHALMRLHAVQSMPWLENTRVRFIRASTSNGVFVTTRKNVDRILSKLMPTLEQHLSIEGLEFSYPTNIGVAYFSESANTIEKLYQNAQLAAEVNQHSHDDWSTFNKQMKSDHKYHLHVLSLLNRDLKNGQLSFVLQPQVNLNDQRIIGAEVLLRWHCKELGNVSPALFIPLAEKTGLIVKITQYVFNTVFSWMSKNPNVVKDRSVSINISAKDLLQPGFCDKIIELKQRYKTPAHQVLLEVTETAIFDDSSVFKANLSRLKEHGFNFSIDDFGTGYSSMLNVISLSPVEIKLDRMFVSSIDTCNINHILSDCIINLCHKTQAQSIAEGIETYEEMLTVKTLNCQIGQGYYFYKPMTPEDYLVTLEKN
ncbi:EAL domain-containing protein [Marinomonas gallaica]|uniref:EAL domain-containing protein n=1 Tax=Marinomonas gallaica TaxID=1806667 RepID=UPI0009EF2360|nr:EAL domain-containing protein [Marinomonas gallaica]